MWIERVISLLLLLPWVVQAASLDDFHHLVHEDTWQEKRVGETGQLHEVDVTAEVWTKAMQTALDQSNKLHVPARAAPYYIDSPLVMKSGQKLTADPGAEIRLKPGSNTCMVRNEHVIGFPHQPVPDDTSPDKDIHIEGGIWTTLGGANGNLRGASSRQDAVQGTHGVILLQNVRCVTVKNITVRDSRAFAVHLANARDFTVENLTLENHGRDGVHVNGPASDGLIRGVRGHSHDDNVALNAWEWKNYAPSFGPIERVVIEEVTGSPEGVRAANSIRLLPGVKRFDDGSTLDCFISDITLRRITDIREFKLYDQPNLELGRSNDFSARIGALRNIRFENLDFGQPGRIEVHADTDGLFIENVRIHHPLTPDWHLLAIGPKSMTYKHGRPDLPEKWTEVFSPDLDCVVRNVRVDGVRTRGSQNTLPVERVAKVVSLQRNPDYPKSQPKGGTGKGIWIR